MAKSDATFADFWEAAKGVMGAINDLTDEERQQIKKHVSPLGSFLAPIATQLIEKKLGVKIPQKKRDDEKKPPELWT